MKPADVDLFIRRLFALRAPKEAWQALISFALSMVLVGVSKNCNCLRVHGIWILDEVDLGIVVCMFRFVICFLGWEGPL